MQKIVPHLWFDKEAKEAAEFYVAAFGGDSQAELVTTLKDTPSGDCDIVSFTIWGYEFMGISAGPLFKPNPSISFMINFDPSQDPDATAKIDEVWAKLSDGGVELMPLGEYPFSKRYGWIQDKYGFSWQLILTDPQGEDRPLIIPSLLFVSESCDQAEVATDYYISVFKNSQRGSLVRYPAGMEPNKEGAVMFTDFQLENQWFAAMDGSAEQHNFAFNEAVSLLVKCDDQAEIDRYWTALSAVPESEQCGWLKDKYGVIWQITPTFMDEAMRSGDRAAIDRITQAFLKMKKLDLETIRQAYEG